LDVGVHDAVLQRLEAAERLPELDARAQVFERDLQRAARDAEQLGALSDPGDLVGVLDRRARGRAGGEPVRLGDSHLVEDEAAHCAAVDPALIGERDSGKPGR
jgi:hypothetical protein